MFILRIAKKLNLFILFQLSFVISNEDINFCDTEKYCDNCKFCEIKTKDNNNKCHFENLFCIQNQSNDLYFNEILLSQYNSFFKNNVNNLNVYGDEEINLNSLQKSFEIIKITNKDNKNLNKIHLYRLILNSRYFNKKTDTAFLSIEYNVQNNKKENNSTKNIDFYIIFQNTKINDYIILIGDDEKIQNLNWKKEINDYDKIIILLEFYNNNIFEDNDDFFKIEIETKNLSKTRRKRIISVAGILAIICILIIVPYLIYSHIKKKKINEEIQRELEKERNKKEEIFQNIFKNILIKTELSSNDVIKNYPQCSICLQTFILKSSICITPCDHVFHYDCLKKFALTKKDDISTLKCPLCNYTFWKDNLKESRNSAQSDRNFYD